MKANECSFRRAWAMAWAACAVVPVTAQTLFQEDFSHYRDVAPGCAREGFSVSNDPIHSRRSELNAQVDCDTDVFLKAKALPPKNAFDVLFDFRLAETNSAIEVVLSDVKGPAVVVPVAGYAGRRQAALKAADGKLVFFVEERRKFREVRTVPLAAELKTVNFRVKAGGAVSLSHIVVRTPEALPTHDAREQFAVLPQRPADLKPSDGSPLALANACVTFVPGRTGFVGELAVTWDSGKELRYPVAVTNEYYSSPIPRYAMADLGLKAGEKWCGPDAVIEWGVRGSLANLYVRPNLKSYGNYRSVSAKGLDVVRDWQLLPPASQHVTEIEVRETTNGFDQVWLDGSYAFALKPARGDTSSRKVVGVTLTLEKGVACRRTEAVDDGCLRLAANPRARAFALARPYSADVALAHYAMGPFSLDADAYTARTPLDGFPSAVHYRLPAAPYARAELLFALDDAPGKVPVLKTRLARYDMRFGTGCTTIADTELDLRGRTLPEPVDRLVRNGREYPVYRMEVDLPMGKCIDYCTGDFVDLEFLGPTEENLQQADNTQKPREDVSSAFNLLSVRLKTLAVVPEMVQASPGNVFTADERVKRTSVRLTARRDGAKGVVRFGDDVRPYALAQAGDTVTLDFDFSDAGVGWYELPVSIEDGETAIVHRLVYCVTPESGRDATAEESPYGTWWFTAHGSPGDGKIGGPIVQKAGIRKITWYKPTPEDCKRYDITSSGFIYAPKPSQFDEATGKFRPGKLKKDGQMVDVDGEELAVANMKAEIAKKPFVDHIMVWHESAPQCGIPEELLGLAAPTNDVAREKKLAAYVNEVGRICRKHFPNLKIQLGNSNAGIGAPTVPMRGGANPDYYDILGMEIPSQTITPERPHDFGFLGQNVTKAIAKKLSGRDIPTGGCYEFIYRAERDLGAEGNDVQAEFHARDILIALMNRYTLIAPGILFDCRNAYCNTLWGVAGILERGPLVYPKKAYLAYAVATKALDGVTFVRSVPTGSSTVYAAEFRRKDGRVATAFWCARGEAEIEAKGLRGELWTMYGRTRTVGGWFSDAKFTCGTAPVYVISKSPCEAVAIRGRSFARDAALVRQSQTAVAFSAANLTVVPDPEMESTHHNFLPYLKPGFFSVKDVVDETEGPCVELTHDVSLETAPITEFVTEYTTLRLKEPVTLPGETALLGLRVKGNSNWAQVRFEIEDADGEVFKGLSTGKTWGCDVYDWPGYTALSFDGWGDIYQYTDSNDYGLIISPGPRDEQWVSGTGGDKRIRYPVKLRAVTIGMNRYKPTILGFEPAVPSIRIKSAWSVQKVKTP